MALRQRIADALGITPKQAPSDVQAVVAAMLPSGTSTPPERGVRGMLNAYNNSPWVRAVASRVSIGVGSVSWQVYAIRTQSTGRYFRSFDLQSKGIERRQFRRRMIDVPEGTELIEIAEHPILELLSGGSRRMPGSVGRQMTQLYLELTGEAFWLLEPRTVNGSTIPVGFWVIPPTWVQDVPTDEDGSYVLDAGTGKTIEIPSPFMLWFANPNPVNPYGRGTGHLRAFGDEIDTDEYTAKYIRSFFYNSARPDLLVYGKDLQKEDVQRLEIGWVQKVRGFLQAHRPFFLNRDVTVKELTYKFQEMQLIELRKWERDLIVNGRGVPPEVLGIIENSNRATIDAADYLFAKGVVEPALEAQRNVLQEELVPKYDERLILGYDSPVEEDHEFQLKAMEAEPSAPTINEWRAVQGLDAVDYGDQHIFTLSKKVVDLNDPDAFNNPSRNDPVPTDDEPPVEEQPPPEDEDDDASMDGERHHHHLTVTKEVGGPHNVDLAEGLGSQMIDDLISAFDDIRNSLDMTAIEAAIARGDVEAVMSIIDAADIPEGLESARQTLKEALFVVMSSVLEEVAGALGVDLTFDMISEAVLQELEEFGAGAVKNVSDASKAAIRGVLVEGYGAGQTPGTMAKEVRLLIGLTEPQARQAVRLYDEWLGKFGQEKADDMLVKWAGKKIRDRADTIVLNELVYAGNRGQEMVWEAAVKLGLLPKDVLRQWKTTPDDHLCDLCAPMHNVTAKVGEPYPNGVITPNQIHVRCRCSEVLIFVKPG